MHDIAHISTWTLEVGGRTLVFNADTITVTLIIMGVLLLFSWAATKSISYVPNPFQALAEVFVSFFYGLCVDALEEELAKKYFPLITCLFLFLFLCNTCGFIPWAHEPTKDLNTTLSLGVMGFFLAHYLGIRAKGLKGYLKEYIEPIIFLAPLNIIGEIAKVVSISFRLFGNIMGGAIIVIVVSHLVYQLVLPPFLVMFFSLFVGTIQAFVFTMLTLVYISVQVK